MPIIRHAAHFLVEAADRWTQSTIEALSALCQSGDIIIDGGNHLF